MKTCITVPLPFQYLISVFGVLGLATQAVASLAVPRAFLVEPEIVGNQRVSPEAVSLHQIQPDVLGMGHHFHMIGPNAGTDFAFVVDFHATRNRNSGLEFVSDTVGWPGYVVIAKQPVPFFIESAAPDPTSFGLLDLVPEQVLHRLMGHCSQSPAPAVAMDLVGLLGSERSVAGRAGFPVSHASPPCDLRLPEGDQLRSSRCSIPVATRNLSLKMDSTPLANKVNRGTL